MITENICRMADALLTLDKNYVIVLILCRGKRRHYAGGTAADNYNIIHILSSV